MRNGPIVMVQTRPAEERRSRTERAWLTAATSLLQDGAGLFVGLVVTPIVLRGLGAELYGGWLIVVQMVGYLALTDLSPMSVLKLTLATEQHLDDVATKRRQIGAALVGAALALPLYVVGGAGLIWAAPWLIHVNPEHVGGIRWALALLVLNLCLGNFMSVPRVVLRGMNLDYKAMGFRSSIAVVTGLLDIAVIKLGMGLPGLAANKVLGAVVFGGVQYVVARRALPWFGASRPCRSDVRRLLAFSFWLFLSSFGYLLSESSDMVLIGWVLGPAASVSYYLTRSLIRTLSQPLSTLLQSVNPGLGELFGRRALGILSNVWLEMQGIAIGFLTVLGCIVLALNRSFVDLWVGPEYFAGSATNVWLVLAASQGVISRGNGAFLDACLAVKQRVILHLASAIASTVLGLAFMKVWGVAGMVGGVVLGQIILTIGYPILLQGVIRQPAARYWSSMTRLLFAGLVLGIPAALIGASLRSLSWLELAGWAALLGAFTGMAVWRLAFDRALRLQALSRLPSAFQGFA